MIKEIMKREHYFKKDWGQVEKKEITENDSFSLSWRAKYLQQQFESVEGYKL